MFEQKDKKNSEHSEEFDKKNLENIVKEIEIPLVGNETKGHEVNIKEIDNKEIKKSETKELPDVKKKLKNYLETLKEEAASPDLLTKIKYKGTQLGDGILYKNLPFTPEDVHRFFSDVKKTIPENAPHKERLEEEIRRQEAYSKNLIKQKENQCFFIETTVDKAKDEVKKKYGDDTTSKEYKEELSKQTTREFVKPLADFLVKNKYIDNLEDYQDQIEEYIEAGAITVSYLSDSKSGYPTFITYNYTDKNGDVIKSTEILDLLTSGKQSPKDKAKAVGYQLTISTPEISKEGDFRKNGIQMVAIARDLGSKYNQEEIENHEITHALNAAKKDAKLEALSNSFIDLSIGTTAGKKMIEQIHKETDIAIEDIQLAVKEYVTGIPISNKNLEKVFEKYENKSTPQKEDSKYFKVWKSRKEFFTEKDSIGWGDPIDELASLSIHSTEIITLAKTGIDKFNKDSELHRTTLGVTRLLNESIRQESDPLISEEKRNDLAFKKQLIGQLFTLGVADIDSEVCPKQIVKLCEKIINYKENEDQIERIDLLAVKDFLINDFPLVREGEISENDHQDISEKLTNSYIAFSEVPDLKDSDKQKLQENFYNLLKDGITDQEQESLKKSIKEILKSDNLPYLDELTKKNALLYNLFINPPEAIEEGIVQEDEDSKLGFRRALINDTLLDIFAHKFTTGYAFHEKPYTRGQHLGGKPYLEWKTFIHSKDPFDISPKFWLLNLIGIDSKIWRGDFGMDGDVYRTYSSDALEGFSFWLGIPVHRIPWLANLADYLKGRFGGTHKFWGDLDKSQFVPNSVVEASGKIYERDTDQNIFSSVLGESVYSTLQTRYLFTMGCGYEIGVTGDIEYNRENFEKKVDYTRLNPNLAHFFNTNPTIEVGIDPADRANLINKLKEDQIMDIHGRLFTVKLNRDEKLVDGHMNIIQNTGLTRGQMSQNLLDDIKSMIIYGETPVGLTPPKWQFGLEMQDYQSKFKTSAQAIKKAQAFDKIGEAMMKEDARRRVNGKKYTLKDLQQAIEESENAPYGSLYNPNGTVNMNTYNRATNPQTNIGGTLVSTTAAKEFLAFYNLAQRRTLLSLGVYEKDYKIMGSPETVLRLGTGWTQTTSKEVTNKDTRLVGPAGGEILEYRHTNGATKYYLRTTSVFGHPTYQRITRNQIYDKDLKLRFPLPQYGQSIEIDPIKALTPNISKKLFGEKETYTVLVGGVPRIVAGRKSYDFDHYTTYDDAIGHVDKIKDARKLAYKFSSQYYMVDKYRAFSQMRKETLEGLLLIENRIRNAVIAATAISVLSPLVGLSLPLVHPTVWLIELGIAFGLQPFMNRDAKGWGNRMLASIEATDAMNAAMSIYSRLEDEKNPPSRAEISTAAGMFETLKFKYRGVLKDFKKASSYRGSNLVIDQTLNAIDKLLK